MKEIAGSIVILAGSITLVGAEHFDSILFWVIGAFMLIDGYFLLAASIFFPEWLTKCIESIKANSINSNQTTT